MDCVNLIVYLGITHLQEPLHLLLFALEASYLVVLFLADLLVVILIFNRAVKLFLNGFQFRLILPYDFIEIIFCSLFVSPCLVYFLSLTLEGVLDFLQAYLKILDLTLLSLHLLLVIRATNLRLLR